MSVETLKTLEAAEIVRPNKRPRQSAPQQLGKTQGLEARIGGSAKGKEKVKDNETISLYTEDKEGGIVLEEGEGPITRGDFAYGEEDIDMEVGDVAGIYESYYWQVPSTQTAQTQTNIQTELVDNYLAVCRNKYSLSCAHECDCEVTKEWMLDSGASLHFTGDINDFVEYSPIENGICHRAIFQTFFSLIFSTLFDVNTHGHSYLSQVHLVILCLG